MKKQQSKNIFRYLSDQFIGSFTGFLIGIWATRLVSHFFATRSIKNLWGLTANKTLVNKQTYNLMQWLASVIVGYLVFEIVFRVIQNQLGPRFSVFRLRFIRLMARTGWYVKIRSLRDNESTIVKEMP